MKSWKVYIQLFNYSSAYAKYVTIQAPITEEQYNELCDAVANDKPLSLCPACKELEGKIESSDPLEILEMAGIFLGVDDYIDSEEEDEDETELDDVEEWEISRADVMDPNEAKRLNAFFVGKIFPKWKNKKETFSFEENDDTRDVMYDVFVRFDEEGKVVEVTILNCEGLESGNERHLYTNEAYPNYEFILEQLEQELEA